MISKTSVMKLAQQGPNPALTVLFVPSSLDSGWGQGPHPKCVKLWSEKPLDVTFQRLSKRDGLFCNAQRYLDHKKQRPHRTLQ